MKRPETIVVAGLLAVAAGCALNYRRFASSENSSPPSAEDYAANTSEASAAMDDMVHISPRLPRGASFPKSVRVFFHGRPTTVHLTGSFVRKKPILFLNLDVYEIASYVERPIQADPEKLLGCLLEEGQTKVYLLRFLRTLSGSEVRGAIEGEIAKTFGDVDVERLKSNIERFTEPFSAGTNAGDVVYLAWLPTGRAYSGYRAPDRLELIANDLPLARAIWRIWAGDTAGPERLGLVQRFAVQTAAK